MIEGVRASEGAAGAAAALMAPQGGGPSGGVGCEEGEVRNPVDEPPKKGGRAAVGNKRKATQARPTAKKPTRGGDSGSSSVPSSKAKGCASPTPPAAVPTRGQPNQQLQPHQKNQPKQLANQGPHNHLPNPLPRHPHPLTQLQPPQPPCGSRPDLHHLSTWPPSVYDHGGHRQDPRWAQPSPGPAVRSYPQLSMWGGGPNAVARGQAPQPSSLVGGRSRSYHEYLDGRRNQRGHDVRDKGYNPLTVVDGVVMPSTAAVRSREGGRFAVQDTENIPSSVDFYRSIQHMLPR